MKEQDHKRPRRKQPTPMMPLMTGTCIPSQGASAIRCKDQLPRLYRNFNYTMFAASAHGKSR